MNVADAIEARRAYRSLAQSKLTAGTIESLARSAQLAPSCFNNQPWRFVFAVEPGALDAVKASLNKGNAWAKNASMIIVVFSKKEDSCVIGEREYYLFDTGMAAAMVILRATELGLVAHPIAGYDPKKAASAVGIPDDYTVIALIIVGKKADVIGPELSPEQAAAESARPERDALADFAFLNRYIPPKKKEP